MVIEQTFDGLGLLLAEKRQYLLERLARMKEGYNRNVELDVAIRQLRNLRDNAVNILTSNVLGGDLDSMKEGIDEKIQAKEKSKGAVKDLALIELRCFSEKIRKSIEETDLIELMPEYVGRAIPAEYQST